MPSLLRTYDAVALCARPHRLRTSITNGETAIALPAGVIEFGTEMVISSGEDIVIAGEGAESTALSGGRRVRMFSLWNNTGLTLSDLTLTNGSSGVAFCSGYRYECSAGAVYVFEAKLTLLRCVVVANAGFVRACARACCCARVPRPSILTRHHAPASHRPAVQSTLPRAPARSAS